MAEHVYNPIFADAAAAYRDTHAAWKAACAVSRDAARLHDELGDKYRAADDAALAALGDELYMEMDATPEMMAASHAESAAFTALAAASRAESAAYDAMVYAMLALESLGEDAATYYDELANMADARAQDAYGAGRRADAASFRAAYDAYRTYAAIAHPRGFYS